eukprot:9729735-Lingulodinium_polyedra.AAC.1
MREHGRLNGRWFRLAEGLDDPPSAVWLCGCPLGAPQTRCLPQPIAGAGGRDVAQPLLRPDGLEHRVRVVRGQ